MSVLRHCSGLLLLPLLYSVQLVTVSSFTVSSAPTPSHFSHSLCPPSTLARLRLRSSVRYSNTAHSYYFHHHDHHLPPSRSTTTTTTTTSLGAYRKIFVAGGSRGVGRMIVEKLSSSSSTKEGGGKEEETRVVGVVALVRTQEQADALSKLPHVVGIVGDAMDQKSVENAMDGCDAAITTLGGSSVAPSTDGQAQKLTQRVDYTGNNNVIESAGILGVTRIILVTSIGCGNSKDAAPPSVFEVLKDVLAAKEKAENVLIKYYTNSNWTIIRPGGLKSEPATGRAILTEDNKAIGSIHREDVADLVLRSLDAPNTERKILSAVDPTLTSNVASGINLQQVKAFALT